MSTSSPKIYSNSAHQEVPQTCDWKKGILISLIAFGALGLFVGGSFILNAKGTLALKFLPKLDLRLSIIVTSASGGTFILATLCYYSTGKKCKTVSNEAKTVSENKNAETTNKGGLTFKASLLGAHGPFHLYFLDHRNTEFGKKLEAFLNSHREDELPDITGIYLKSFGILSSSAFPQLQQYPQVMELFLLSDEELGNQNLDDFASLVRSIEDTRVLAALRLRLITFRQANLPVIEGSETLILRQIHQLSTQEIKDRIPEKLYYLLSKEQLLGLMSDPSLDFKHTFAHFLPDPFFVYSTGERTLIDIFASSNVDVLKQFNVQEINQMLPAFEIHHLQSLSREIVIAPDFDIAQLFPISNERESQNEVNLAEESFDLNAPPTGNNAKVRALFTPNIIDENRFETLNTLADQNFVRLHSLVPFLGAPLIRKIKPHIFANNRLQLERLKLTTLNCIFYDFRNGIKDIVGKDIAKAMGESLDSLLEKLYGSSLIILAITNTLNLTKLSPRQIENLFSDLKQQRVTTQVLDTWGVEKVNFILDEDFFPLHCLSDKMLQNPQLELSKLPSKRLNGMFGYGDKRGFIEARSRIRLIPPEKINEILHLLEGRILALLVPGSFEKISFFDDERKCRLTNDQLNAFFDRCEKNKEFDTSSSAAAAYTALGIDNINLFLRFLNLRSLELLPGEVLGDERLQLEVVDSNDLNLVFSCRKYNEVKTQFQQIHPQTINRIFYSLLGATLALMSNDQLSTLQLKDKDKEICILTKQQVKDLCKACWEQTQKFGVEDRLENLFRALSVENLNLLLPLLEDWTLKYLPKEYLGNPDVLEKIGSRLPFVFAYRNKNEYEKAKQRFQGIHPLSLNKVLPFLEGATLSLLSKEQAAAISLTDPYDVGTHVPAMFEECRKQAKCFSIPNRSSEILEAMSIEQVNLLLPSMKSTDLKALPKSHLNNPGLELSKVDPSTLNSAFNYKIKERSDFDSAKELVQSIHPQIIHEIAPVLNGNILALLSQTQLQHLTLYRLDAEGIEGCRLSERQVRELFNASRQQEDRFKIQNRSQEIWLALGCEKINTFAPFLSLSDAVSIPYEILFAENFHLNKLKNETLKGLFSCNSPRSFQEVLSRVRNIPIEGIQRKIKDLPGEALAFLSAEQLGKLEAGQLSESQIQSMFAQASYLNKTLSDSLELPFRGSVVRHIYNNLGSRNLDAVMEKGTFSAFQQKNLLPTPTTGFYSNLHLLSEKDLDEVFKFEGSTPTEQFEAFQAKQRKMELMTDAKEIQNLFSKLTGTSLALLGKNQLRHIDVKRALDESTLTPEKINHWFATLKKMHLHNKQVHRINRKRLNSATDHIISNVLAAIPSGQLKYLLPHITTYLKYLPKTSLEVDVLSHLTKDQLKKVFKYVIGKSMEKPKSRFQSMKSEVVNELLKQNLLDEDCLIFMSKEQIQEVDFNLLMSHLKNILLKLKSKPQFCDVNRPSSFLLSVGFEKLNTQLAELDEVFFNHLPLDFFKNPTLNFQACSDDQLKVIFHLGIFHDSQERNEITQSRLRYLATYNAAIFIELKSRLQKIDPNLNFILNKL